MENGKNLIHSFQATPDVQGNYSGLTKLEYFTGLAMQAILQNRELQLAYYKDITTDKQRFPNITNLNCLAVHAIDEASEILKQLELHTGA